MDGREVLFDHAGARNRLLARLTPEEADRLSPHLEYIDTQLGDILLNAGDPIDYLYFPDSSMASVVGTTSDGSSVEIGVIGKEGMVGAEYFLGAKQNAYQVSIQMPDGGYKLPAELGLQEFARAGSFQKNVLRFFYRLHVQVSQTAVCNAIHSVEERLARWLLMCQDRSPDNKIRLTQEFLGLMVASTRQTVSAVAGFFQDAKAISYSRGVIEVTDRNRLEGFACDCYKIMRNAQEL